MAQPPLIYLKDASLTFGGHPLFDQVSIALQAGERACLVGRNGSGKSTLLKALAGQIQLDAGERFVQPGIKIAYLDQSPDFGDAKTLTEYVSAGLSADEEHASYQVEAALAGVQLPGDKSPAALSGGEARRASLARVMVSDPDILLLDEPTNHLDLPTIEWLEGALAGLNTALLCISHDRRFLANLTRATFWLDRSVIRKNAKGFAHFETWSEEILEQERVNRAKLNKLIAEETRWSHQGISARRTRNQGRLRRLADLRNTRSEQISETGNAKIVADQGTQSGKMVIEAHSISKSYGERHLITDFSTKILRGDRVGIIGPNGVGKSTLLKMLMGTEKPDSGTVKFGTNLTPIYIDQNRTRLDPETSLWETLADVGGDQIMVQGKPRHVVSYLKDFLFEEKQARSPVKALSGGERNRLLLAKSLALPSNLMVLDEPTNDLDIETLDLLQEMLSDYAGTVMLISHDRDFLDRLVTSTIAFEEDGSLQEYPGGYEDYFRQRKSAKSSKSSKGKGKSGNKSGSDAKKDNASGKSKLSYVQRIALEKLPGQMEALELQKKALEKTLSDPNIYTKSPDLFRTTTAELDKTHALLATSESKWLELSLLADS